MLSVLTTKKTNNNKTRKGHEETFGGDKYVYYLDCGDGTQGYACVQTHQIVHIKYVQFLYIHYTSIQLFKKKDQAKKK